MKAKQCGLVILAAGKGTRMKSRSKNKVAMNLAKKPMILYILDWAKKIGFGKVIIVVGFKKNSIIKISHDQFQYIEQKQQLGTAHAVKTALPFLPANITNVMVVFGDHAPFYNQQRIKKILDRHLKKRAQITITTTNRDNPTGYGRIVKNSRNQVVKIVEQANASDKETKIKEVNAGCSCYQLAFLKKYLSQIKKNLKKGEYVLVDLVKLAVKSDIPVNHVFISTQDGPLGVNTRRQLQEANRFLSRKRP